MLVLSDLQTGNVGDIKVCGTRGYVLMCVGATVLGGWMGPKFTMRITSATWIYHHNTLYYSLPAVCVCVCVCVCGDSKERGT